MQGIGKGRRRRECAPLKVFVLTLALILPGGGTTEVPIEIWTFARQSDCTMSAVYLNTGSKSPIHHYRCVEADPVRLAADIKSMGE